MRVPRRVTVLADIARLADLVSRAQIETTRHRFVTDEDWSDLVLASGWSSTGAPHPAVRRDANGVVYMRGIALGAGAPSLIGTLPSWNGSVTYYRPDYLVTLQCLADGMIAQTAGQLLIRTNGNVEVAGITPPITTAGLYLDHHRWLKQGF